MGTYHKQYTNLGSPFSPGALLFHISYKVLYELVLSGLAILKRSQQFDNHSKYFIRKLQ